MKVLILLALCGVAMVSATHSNTCIPSSTQLVTRNSRWSSKGDDDTSYATCPVNYQMVSCKCITWSNRPGDCDGAQITNSNGEVRCVASNGHGGHGVYARATCRPLIVTCSTPYVNMPVISCPGGYKIVGCTTYSDIMHNLWTSAGVHPYTVQSSTACCTSSGCSKCQVQAICVYEP